MVGGALAIRTSRLTPDGGVAVLSDHPGSGSAYGALAHEHAVRSLFLMYRAMNRGLLRLLKPEIDTMRVFDNQPE